jgi:VCBS repeat-containing protein
MDSNTSRAVAVALMVAGALGVSACSSSSTTGSEDASKPSTDASHTRDTGHGDAAKADAGHKDAGKSDAGKAEAGKAEAGHPDAERSDAKHPDAAKTDSGKTDASGTDAGDAGPDCGTIPPVGKQIVASTDPLALLGQGLTSDGYAFYEDTNTQVLYAVPAAGGSPSNLGSMTSQGRTFYLNGGKAVLFLPEASNVNTGLAPLSAWTAASGPAVISTGAVSFYDAYAYSYDVTLDGTKVLYFASTDSLTATLTVSSIDGKTQTKIAQNIDLTNEYCVPMAQFTKDTVVAYYCLAAPTTDAAVGDAGVGALTIASFASPAYNQVTLVTVPAPTATTPLYNPAPVSADGTKLLLSPYQGLSDLALYPIAGGAPTTVDPSGVQGGFLPTGDIIYTTQSGALMSYAVTDAGVGDAGAALALATDVGGLLALSPDGKWLQVMNAEDQYYLTNLFLASATTPGTLTTLWSATSAEALGFTMDSKYEAFATNVSTNFGSSNFDLQASEVSGGGAPTKILTSAGGFAFTTASKLVINVNGNAVTGNADIEAIDLSDPTAASTLVTQADPSFFYAPGPKQILYSWNCTPTAAAGVWTVSAP